MRILILDAALGNNYCLVRFSSPFGYASGHWYGDAPEVGQSYDVEIDLPAFGSPDVTIRCLPNDQIKPTLCEVNGGVVLVGIFVPGPVPKTGAIHLGEWLVLCNGAPSDWTEGTPVQIDARFITLYPYQL